MTERSAGIVEVIVDVVNPAWEDTGIDVHGIVDAAVRSALAAGTEDAGNAEIGVRLTDDADIRTLNRTWRDRDAATNVLAFAISEAPVSAGILGDVVVAFGTCAREARDQEKSLADHLSHLVVHGTLHLLGFDHTEDDAAEVMEGLERAVLAGLGVADPYAGEAAA